jgi:hypothetical protein
MNKTILLDPFDQKGSANLMHMSKISGAGGFQIQMPTEFPGHRQPFVSHSKEFSTQGNSVRVGARMICTATDQKLCKTTGAYAVEHGHGDGLK